MATQLKTNLKFHPEFRKSVSSARKRKFPKQEKSEEMSTDDSSVVNIQEILTMKTGKYELLFDGFYPLLDVDLNEEFVEKLFSKRQRLADEGNLWEVESHRIVKMMGNSHALYGKQAFGSKTLMNSSMQFECEGYLLDKVKILQVKLILAASHLM